jgi:multidrug efflux system membrane fusion protein
MIRKMPWCAFGIILLAACQKGPKTGPARQSVPVRTAAVMTERLSEPVRTSGFLSSEAQTKLSFKTGGIVDRLYAKEGERVRKGQVLAALKLDEIRAMAEQAKNGYEKSERDFSRAQNLYKDSVATLEQVQDARTGLNVAKSNLEIAEFNLTHSRIEAPSEGRILKRLVEENELIGPGYPAFLFGTDGSAWVVKAGVIDRDAVRLGTGDSASVVFDAFPKAVFSGTVRTMAGAPDPMTGLFEVEIDIRKGPHNFINGLFADTEIIPSSKRGYRIIPFEALVEVTGMQGSVYTVSRDSLARKIPVVIGFLTNRTAAVEKGLENVDRVITEGSAYLNEGMPVKVIAD